MRLHRIIAAAATLVCATVSGIAAAQSTIGFAATVVIPIAVNSASYSTEVWVSSGRNNSGTDVNVTFYEANSSTTPGAVYNCGTIAVGGNARTTSFQLAAKCALPAGSRHGMLILEDAAAEKTHFFSAYSRVQNPQAIGFSVEGFPIGSLSPQSQNMTGLKRTLPPASIPFQTNCFVGALGLPVNYQIRLFDGTTAAPLGAPVTGSLAPYQMSRHLDIFAAAGLASGDYSNVSAQVANTDPFPDPVTGEYHRGMFVSFCTVQDNVSFGADFRVGKSFDAWDRSHNHAIVTCAPPDCPDYDFKITDLSKKHVFAMYIRPPDNVRCDLYGDRVADLEIALGSGDVPSFTPFRAGGNDQTGFYYSSGTAMVDPGDGTSLRNFYPLLVSARETDPPPALPIPYAIACRSGNGGNLLELPFEFADDF